jgi:D-glycero-alpha-D-manno-heptose 1-phosphate guanylyltransferase
MLEEKTETLPDAMVQEMIVLAGGFGTRIQSVAAGVPKVLLPVAGRPFLSHLIDFFRMQGIARFVFSLHYKAEVIEQYLKEEYPTLDYATAIEDHPLGTGGAIRLALQKTKSNHVIITNGDTLFKVDLPMFIRQHLSASAECSLALKPVTDAGRYGSVIINQKHQILSFSEKGLEGPALINGGLYLLDKTKFFQRSFPQRFSFEKDYLQSATSSVFFYGFQHDAYFVDIGIPNDYEKAQLDLARTPPELRSLDKTWTVFIDRDGVINDERLGEYVLHWDQFIFSSGVLSSFKKLSDVFGRVLIVTNQKGVGRGLMTKQALDTIHYEMQREVEIAGGRIDKIYYCADIDNKSLRRKPNPGMALQAKADYPDINLERSIMVGNKPSDMRFGRSAGMVTVFLATTNPEVPFPHPDIDFRFRSLAEFVTAASSAPSGGGAQV